jgi:hypothetical protein
MLDAIRVPALLRVADTAFGRARVCVRRMSNRKKLRQMAGVAAFGPRGSNVTTVLVREVMLRGDGFSGIARHH